MIDLAIRRDDATVAFLAATKRGEFLIVCDNLSGVMHGPQFDVTIDPCRFAYVPSAGTGTVVSWSVVHQRNGLRLAVGIVELDEGPWWWTSFPKVNPNSNLVGARVEVAFEVVGDGDAAEAIPYFCECASPIMNPRYGAPHVDPAQQPNATRSRS